MSSAATAMLVRRPRPLPAAAEPVATDAADEDLRLARRAAAGDGAAFATLYDRYERRAYNLCYRITGSSDDAADATQETFLKVLERLPGLAGRELNFGAYLLTAARHASYDAIARRRRADPAGEIPDSAVPVGAGGGDPDGPERQALLEAHQEEIRAANESLPPRQREALALRELEDLSYDEVAEIMGMNRNSVAQLISRARINLRDGMRLGALASVTASSPLCEQALPLLAMRQDDALDDAGDASWLAGHLSACATCRVRVTAMEEAGVAYRLWLPLVPVLWLRDASIAKAAERVGADWSAVCSRAAAHRRARSRRLAAAAGGILVLAAVGLVAAERAESPLRPWAAAPPPAKALSTAAVAVPAETAPARRRRKAPRRAAAAPRVKATGATTTAATTAAAVPASPEAPEPVERGAPLAKPEPADPVATPAAPEPPPSTAPDPPPGGTDSTAPKCPGATPSSAVPVDPRCPQPPARCPNGPNCPPPPPPPCPNGPNCPPPPQVCQTCGLTIVTPPPVRVTDLSSSAGGAAKVGRGQKR